MELETTRTPLSKLVIWFRLPSVMMYWELSIIMPSESVIRDAREIVLPWRWSPLPEDPVTLFMYIPTLSVAEGLIPDTVLELM